MDVVQQPEVLADAVAVDLAGDQQHLRGARVGRRESGRRVVDADSGHDHGHPGTTGGPRVTVGHVGGRLLVAGDDVADLGDIDEGIERGHQLIAREAEDDLHTLGAKLADEGGATGHLWSGDRRAPDVLYSGARHLNIVSMLQMTLSGGRR